MIELEIPHNLLQILPVCGKKWSYNLSIWITGGGRAKSICFRQDVEDWLTTNIKNDLQIGHHNSHPGLLGNRYFAQFSDKRDATLFKLFWL
jgi:hypothetical protein